MTRPPDTMAGSSPITRLLQDWAGGDASALDRLTPLVYEELRRLARGHMQKEAPGHQLQSTALVHEAYLRLVGAAIDWRNRKHFFAVAARVMRRILVDAARERAAVKRGGPAAARRLCAVNLDELPDMSSQRAEDLCALNDALDALASVDPRRARVVELRFFGGLSVEEAAEILDVSPQTVMRDWRLARAWLTRELRP